MQSTASTSASVELAFALEITEKVGQHQLRSYQPGIDFETKSDGSEVTKIDRESERLIREAIGKKFPNDDILGEEQGATRGVAGSAGDFNSSGKRRWLIDPIDGTANFVRGIPIFSTLLALEQNGEVILGVIHAPAMTETFWAEKGAGAYKNGNRIATSKVNILGKAQFHFGEPQNILSQGYQSGLNRIIEATYRHRCFGDYLNFAYVFEGKAEGALEIGVNAWDLAPMRILASEAGGRFSDLAGGQTIETGNCLVSNAALHADFLTLLGQTPR
jgi:histidinol-phosphatase